MLANVQPCFQLLRIGSSVSDSVQDLYTFRPALSHSVFRLGRAGELCDVTLDSTSVSLIHAELHAEKETNFADTDQLDEGWRVHIRDQSSHGETKVYIIHIWMQSGIKYYLVVVYTVSYTIFPVVVPFSYCLLVHAREPQAVIKYRLLKSLNLKIPE